MKPKRLLSLFCLAALVLSGCGQTAGAAGALPTTAPSESAPTSAPAGPVLDALDSERTVIVDGLERAYLLHIPAGLPADALAPLVLVFHGFGLSDVFARQMTGFNDIADSDGFVVAYPSGTGPNAQALGFDGGLCCGNASRDGVDEPAFVRAILADIGTLIRIDPKRTYATGWDNGSFVAERLACEMSTTFAAVAGMSGAVNYEPCEPEEPVSVLYLHGMNDTFMPYEGGGNIFGQIDTPFPPVEEALLGRALRNGCTRYMSLEQDETITRIAWERCPAGIDVQLIQLKNTGHAWPSPYAFPLAEMIWTFFAEHPKP
jgi:polyhydroxybutyrate depolymerase